MSSKSPSLKLTSLNLTSLKLTSLKLTSLKLLSAVVALATVAAVTPALAQTASTAGTRAIENGSDAAKKARLKEPSYMTREERLNAKPLDWSTTTGKPKPRTLTAAERRALQDAKPEQSAGGAPAPNADEEAKKQHPDDWK
jgi:hypothetical protein